MPATPMPEPGGYGRLFYRVPIDVCRWCKRRLVAVERRVAWFAECEHCDKPQPATEGTA